MKLCTKPDGTEYNPGDFAPSLRNGLLLRKVRKDKGRRKRCKLSRVLMAMWRAGRKEWRR